MRPFTGSPRLLIDFACTRIFPSGVGSTAPLTLKGMSIFLSSFPFCLRTPSSNVICRSLTGGLPCPGTRAKTCSFMSAFSEASPMAVSPASTATT